MRPVLKLIIGRSGRGKSDTLTDMAAACAKSGKRVVLLLPEQYTFDGEITLARKLGGALLFSEALGVSRLADRVLSEAGGTSCAFLTPEGKRMALRCAINKKADELTFYGKVGSRGGFLDKAGDLIDAFKSANLTAEAVKEAASKLDDPALSRKLSDIAAIYAGMDEFMEGRFSDRSDKISAMLKVAHDSTYLKDLNVFMDFPHAFLYDELTYSVVRSLAENCESVTMVLRLCGREDSDAELFAGEVNAIKKLSAFADLKYMVLKEPTPRESGILAAEKYLFAPLPKKLPDGAGVTLCPAMSVQLETAAAAERISALLSDGARPSDVYVAACDAENLAPRLRALLSRMGINLFMDERRPLSGHPIVELVTASLSAATKGFKREDVLRAAKSGLAPLTTEQAELFEDYCKRFGIGYGAFLSPFTKGGATRPRLLCAAEEARELLMPHLASLSSALKQCKDAKSCAKAVYDYTVSIDLWGRLNAVGEGLTGEGRFEEAEENAQVWNAYLQLLDEIAELMAGPMTPADFLSVLDEGFAAHSLGMIPPTTNAVCCGSVQTASGRDIKHLLVIGANDGRLPADTSDDGIINDRDIQKLKSVGIDAFASADSQGAHERHITYAILARPTKTLYVSWSLTDESGKPMSPSYAADKLCMLFPDAVKPYNRATAADATDAETGFEALIRGLRALADSGVAEEGLNEVYAYYARSEEYAGRLKAAEARLFAAQGMNAENARALYGDRRGSTATRLEKFNRCPFSYLVAYGLCPDPVKKYEEAPSDEGDFYHEAFCEFLRLMESEQRDWATITDDEAQALFTPILDAVAATHNEGIFAADAKNARALVLLKRAALRTLLATIEQARRGTFVPKLAEAALGEDLPAIRIKLSDGGTATLVGRVDRIDIAAPRGERTVPYVRVVDYKTGNLGFSYSELVSGLQLQLPLYLKAAGALGKPTGMFYLHVGDPVTDASDDERDELKNFKLRGILLDDVQIARAMDGRAVSYSPFLPVRFTKAGMSATTAGAIVSEAELKTVFGIAEGIAAETVERILAGEAGATPARTKNQTACDWCEYGAICRFEPNRGGRYNNIAQVDPRALFDGKT